jgi:hypothetical protein
MRILGSMIILAGLAFAGGASAAMPVPAGLGATAAEGLLQEVQYRGERRGYRRCFNEVRRVRFIDRFGRQRVRIVERRVCR